ncbi:MAG TPA: hypothetical protein VGA13_05945 [Acidimicrobiales bacterium]
MRADFLCPLCGYAPADDRGYEKHLGSAHGLHDDPGTHTEIPDWPLEVPVTEADIALIGQQPTGAPTPPLAASVPGNKPAGRRTPRTAKRPASTTKSSAKKNPPAKKAAAKKPSAKKKPTAKKAAAKKPSAKKKPAGKRRRT